MTEGPYVVMPVEGHWTVGFSGQLFGRFASKEDATLTAVMWAHSAKRKGRDVRVMVEENGRIRMVWGEESVKEKAA